MCTFLLNLNINILCDNNNDKNNNTTIKFIVEKINTQLEQK